MASEAAPTEHTTNNRVSVRVRPLNRREHEAGGSRCLVVHPYNRISIGEREYDFDYVADENSTQEEIFNTIARPVADNCLNGYNGCIFAYGQTSSGKTFTMQGAEARTEQETYRLRGVAPRVTEYIFGHIERQQQLSGGTLEFCVRCSLLEIYNEQLSDLFNPGSSTPVTLMEDVRKGVYVNGLVEVNVSSAAEAIARMKEGLRYRHVGSTRENEDSSRSHCVFTLSIQSKEMIPSESIHRVKYSRLNLVDLAGSERQKRTEAAGATLKEANMINKSLTTLGAVMRTLEAVSNKKTTHIRYRDSKLTFLLKDSLGGNSQTSIIATFAQCAKKVRNKAVVNHDLHTQDLMKLRAEIKSLQRRLEARSTFASVDEYSNKVQDLESQLQAERSRVAEQAQELERLRRAHEETFAFGTPRASMRPSGSFIPTTPTTPLTAMPRPSTLFTPNSRALYSPSVMGDAHSIRAPTENVELRIWNMQQMHTQAIDALLEQHSRERQADVRNLAAAIEEKIRIEAELALQSRMFEELSAINEILNVQRSELQQRIEVLSDEVSFKESELTRERTKAKEDAEQHERQARLLEAANKKIENLQRQNEAQEEQLRQLLNTTGGGVEDSALKEQLSGALSENSQLKKELEEMRTRADANAEFHSTLTEQVVELTEQLQREIRNSEESKAKCADLTKIALEKDNKLMRKKAKLNQYKNEEAESNEGLERMRAEIADLMSALESKTTEIADLQTTMQEAQLRYSDDLREVIEKNEDQQQLIESLRATVLQEKQLAVEVQQQLSRQEKELDRLRPLVETCDQLEAQLEQSNQQRDAYHATILAHEQTIQQLNATIEQGKLNVAQLEARLLEDRSRAEQERDRMLVERASADQQISALLSSQTQELTEMRGNLERAENQLKEIPVLHEQLAKVQSELSSKHDESSRLRGKLDSLLAACASLEQVGRRKEDEIASLNEQLLGEKLRLKETQGVAARLESEKNELIARVQDLDLEVQHMQERLATLESDLQAQRRVYNEQRYLLAQTQDTLVSVTTQRDEGLEKLAQYRSRVEQLSNAIEELQSANAHLSADNQFLQERMQQLETENSALAGHSNQQQRIQVLARYRQERDNALQELAKLQAKLEKKPSAR